jgi:hypothetical protein
MARITLVSRRPPVSDRPVLHLSVNISLHWLIDIKRSPQAFSYLNIRSVGSEINDVIVLRWSYAVCVLNLSC